MLQHKTITIFTKSKNNQLNNVHAFLYSKLVWEDCIVNLLRSHGKNVLIGSESQDINGIDMLAESKQMSGMFYPLDVKLIVKAASPEITQKCKLCIAVNEYTVKTCTDAKSYNTFLVFVDEYFGKIFFMRKSDLAKCKYYNCYRGDMYAYEFLISEMLQYTHDIELTEYERNIVIEKRKKLNELWAGKGISKIGFQYNYTHKKQLEILNKAIVDLGLDKTYNVHFNFI